jgi:Phosphoenolpyruvate synthase/pyruvate phosphate dikinase
MFDNYIYGNQNAVWLYMGQNPLVIKDVPDLISKMSYIKEKFSYVQDLPVAWARDLDTYLLGIGALMAEDIASKTEAEVWDFINRTTTLGIEYFKPNIAISITQSMLYKVFTYILITIAGPTQGKHLFDALIATSETKTALVNRELYALAKIVKNDAKINDIIHKNTSKEIISQNMLGQFADFYKEFRKFLSTHGHRETDFDAYIPTWVEAPNVVLDNIRLIVDTLEKENPRNDEYEAKYATQKAEAELFAKTPQQLHLFLYELIRLVRTYTSLDDIEHYQTMRLTLPIRKGAKALGLLLKKKEIVQEEMDVFFAHIESLDGYISGKKSAQELKIEIEIEKSAYLKNKERTPAWELNAVSPQFAAAEGETTLVGVAGSPGEVEGTVFIIRSTEDFSSFPKNAVLVARTTNPAWTPLFYNACAVITESGGALSHGAVTAREMKLPAVMSVRGVLNKLKNGQRVRVDGSNGTVFLIDQRIE